MEPSPIINVNKISPETEKRIVAMYRNGKSMCSIAKELSVSSGTIYLHLRKFVSKEDRQKRQHVTSFSNEQAKKFCALYEKGMSSIEIGKKFGFGADVVLYALRKLGVDTSKGGKYSSRVNPEKLSKMKEIYGRTGSVLETAKEMNLHPSSVHSRLSKEGVVKKKALNQKMVKEKYDKLNSVLIRLFKEMGIELEYFQAKYNGPGPDMIVREGKKKIVVEHKATVKRSFYWQHAVEEARNSSRILNIRDCWVITTARKPGNFRKVKGVKITFFDDLKELLISNGLTELVEDIEYISNTPCV